MITSIDNTNSAAPPAPERRSGGAEPNAIREATERRVEQAAEQRQAAQADPAQKAENLLREVRKRIPTLGNRLQIEIDNQARRFVYYSVNRETGEVVKQYPSTEELRRLSIGQDAGGISVDKRI